jgi:carboxymethylenebutenolidase
MDIKLKADDGHELAAYVARPSGSVSRAVVVIQEIFGVNRHIRSVVDGFAQDGYLAIAPALFDRVERGVELAYTPDDMKRGFSIASKIGMEDALRDVATAAEYAASQLGNEHVGVVGYCWGGSLAWVAATRLRVNAAVGYYGGRIAQYANEKANCPVMLHFGAKDPHIPASEIDKIRAAHPDVPIYMYDAGHGFNCEERKDFDPRSAALARTRTLDFLQKYV